MTDELDDNDELDDELQGLLDELDERDADKEDLVASTFIQEDKPTVSVDQPILDRLDELEEINKDDEEFVLRPSKDVRRMTQDDVIVSSTTEETIEPKFSIDVIEYKKQLDIVTHEVLQACRADRQEAQDVINDLKSRMSQTGGGAAPKALVDGLVKAVEVKANINQNAIRMMDTNAKFLSAIKSVNNTTNNNSVITASAEELKKILG